jgi:hypothetical protein
MLRSFAIFPGSIARKMRTATVLRRTTIKTIQEMASRMLMIITPAAETSTATDAIAARALSD